MSTEKEKMIAGELYRSEMRRYLAIACALVSLFTDTIISWRKSTHYASKLSLIYRSGDRGLY